MNSRSIILSKVKENKPSIETSINLSQFLNDDVDDLIQTYSINLEANGGKVSIPSKEDDLQKMLLKEIGSKSFVDLSGIIKSQKGFDINSIDQLKELVDVKVLIISGEIGVAENGAVWLEDKNLQNIRILPFIVEHTIFILEKRKIVNTMHEAYKKLGILKTGFGTFIAGPSKTGDIEQNLVIGAHGPLSHLVILV